jgi:hypothetical protein
MLLDHLVGAGEQTLRYRQTYCIGGLNIDYQFVLDRCLHLEKRILRLYKGGTGMVKIGKTLGIGTALVQRVVTEQPRPFDVAEAYAAQ